jgi:hypothetical protein
MNPRHGPGEGTWAVFAEKAVKERDKARAEIERLRDVLWGIRLITAGIEDCDMCSEINGLLIEELGDEE